MVHRKLFRPTLTEIKEPHSSNNRPHSSTNGPQPHKKPAPPEQTHAENFYWIKQMQARTPVVVVMTDRGRICKALSSGTTRIASS